MPHLLPIYVSLYIFHYYVDTSIVACSLLSRLYTWWLSFYFIILSVMRCLINAVLFNSSVWNVSIFLKFLCEIQLIFKFAGQKDMCVLRMRSTVVAYGKRMFSFGPIRTRYDVIWHLCHNCKMANTMWRKTGDVKVTVYGHIWTFQFKTKNNIRKSKYLWL